MRDLERPDAPLLDRAIFDALREVLDPADLLDLAREAETEIARRLDALNLAEDGAGFGAPISLAHDLAGLCAQIGLAALAEAARSLERACRAGDRLAAETALRALGALRAPSMRALAEARTPQSED